MHLELSEEKTLITNAQKSAKFLSYEIRVRNSNLTKRDKTGRLVRNYTGRVVLEVSNDTIKKHLLNIGAMKLTYHNGKEIWKPKAMYRLKDCDDLEILDYYNSMIRGFCNYYLKLRTSKKPVDHEKSIDNATKVTKLSSH